MNFNFSLYIIIILFVLTIISCGAKGPPKVPEDSLIQPWSIEYTSSPLSEKESAKNETKGSAVDESDQKKIKSENNQEKQ